MRAEVLALRWPDLKGMIQCWDDIMQRTRGDKSNGVKVKKRVYMAKHRTRPQTRRYLASALIAYSRGVGMDYARKKYAHMPVGPFWVEVARMGARVRHRPMRGQPSSLRRIEEGPRRVWAQST
jgi:hypothetical protein